MILAAVYLYPSSRFISHTGLLRHTCDDTTALDIFQRKFLLWSSFSANFVFCSVFPTVSLSLFSPLSLLICMCFDVFYFFWFTPLLHCTPELLQRCLRFRHTLGTCLSPSAQGRRSQTTKPYFFPWVSCSSVLSSCTLQELITSKSFLWYLKKHVFSLNRVHR